jgi:hypothetical protein
MEYPRETQEMVFDAHDRAFGFSKGACDGVADRSARPGVEDHRDIGEAFPDSDVRDVCDPELIRPVNRQVLGAIGVDRLVVALSVVGT